MDPDGPLLYIIFFALVIMSGFFSMSETAFAYCNRIKLKVKADDGNKSAKLALNIVENFDNSLITILIGNNIVNILSSTIATVIGIFLFKENGTLVATVFTTVVVLLFGEIIPKNIATVWSDRIALITCYPIYFLKIILFPLSIVYMGFLKLLNKIFKTDKKDPVITEDEFTDIIESIEEEGLIEEEESDIIQSAVDFGDITIKEIYTKLENVVAIDINSSKDQITQTLLEENYSRIPVYSSKPDNIIGILHVRTYLKQVMTKKDYSIKKTLIKPFFVNVDSKIDDVFEEFRKKKMHIAIVVDNNKKVIGMVTMEDVLEELVGEIDEVEKDVFELDDKDGDLSWL